MWATANADICHNYLGWKILPKNCLWKKRQILGLAVAWVLSQRRFVLFWSALLTQFLPVLHLPIYEYMGIYRYMGICPSRYMGICPYIWANICLCVSIYSCAAAFSRRSAPILRLLLTFWGTRQPMQILIGKRWVRRDLIFNFITVLKKLFILAIWVTSNDDPGIL